MDININEVASGSKDLGVSFVNTSGSEDTRPLGCYVLSTGKQLPKFRGCSVLIFKVKQYKKDRQQHAYDNNKIRNYVSVTIIFSSHCIH